MRWLLLLVSVASCDRDGSITVLLPEGEEIGSMVVSFSDDDGLDVYAENIDPGVAFEPPFAVEVGWSGRIDLLAYRAPLDQLDLEPGRLEETEIEPRVLLPEPSRHYAVAVDEGVAGETTAEEGKGALEDFHIPKPMDPPPESECPIYSTEQIDLELERTNEPWAGFEIAVSSTVVLVGSPTHGLFRITDRGAERWPIAPSGPRLSAGTMDEEGQLWFADTEGTLYRGSLGAELRLERVATSTLGAIDVLAVGRSGELVEAFAIVPPYQGTIEWNLIRFDGERWRLVRHLCSLPSCDLISRAALARLGPGEAVAMPRKRRTLTHYRQGTITEIAVPSLGFAYSLANVPPFGTLIGTEYGEILRYRGEWEAVGELGTIEVHALTKHGDGLLIGGPGGRLTYFVPSDLSCPIELVAATGVVRFVRFGEAQIAIGELGDGGDLPLTIIRTE